MTDPFSILAFIGIIVSLSQLQKLLDFIWFYFFRPTNSYKSYLQGPSPYALITGSTDGIGKGVAKDLYCKGFNLILHGRNEEKMKKVIEELRALGGRAREGGDIRMFIADVTKDGHDFGRIVKGFEGLNITIVVNNVGGGKPRPTTLDGWAEEELLELIRWNALFPTLLTRALLPNLRQTSYQRPVLVAYVGSLVSTNSLPCLPIYSASKAFILRLTQCLHADERFESGHSQLSIMTLLVGEVNSSTYDAPVSWLCPAADDFAKSVVNTFGCDRRVVIPHIGHAVPSYLTSFIPAGIQAKMYRTVMTQVLGHVSKEA